jgi:hypothetical protein
MMTSVSHRRAAPQATRIASHAALLAAILFAWFLTMAASARFLPVSDDYLAIGPEHRIVGNLPSGARILRTANHSVAVNMTDPEAAKALYSAGAWIVLPALANGCLAMRRR